jgi:hypothetical protein
MSPHKNRHVLCKQLVMKEWSRACTHTHTHTHTHTLFEQNGKVSVTQSLWIKRAVAAAGSIEMFSASPGMCDTAMLLFDCIAKKTESTVPVEVRHLSDVLLCRCILLLG